MESYESFRNRNISWNNGIYGCYASDDHMQKNYEIAKKMEEEFYKWYQRDLKTPQKGDMAKAVNYNWVYPNAQIEKVDKYGMMELCENGSSFFNGRSFSTSGGAFFGRHKSHFEFDGYTERMVWTWGCLGSGAGQGIYFPITVKKFAQKDIELVHNQKIFIGGWHCRDSYYKVVIRQRHDLYNCMSFKTVAEFKKWAEMVGLTYRRSDAGRNEFYANQFIIDDRRGFRDADELPENKVAFEGYSNGSLVRCYASKEGDTITIHRPNPNSKAYVTMEGEPILR